jgi:hypothetical protein
MKKIIRTLKGIKSQIMFSPAIDKLKKLKSRRHKEKLQRKKDARNKKMS